jgi:hypothetical protein
MGRLSQAAKAGLAAGLIFGAIIGVIHLTTLAVCSSAQLNYITGKLQAEHITNQTASGVFGFDLVYYPMVNGLTGFILGEILAVGYGAAYLLLPGSNSKRKGELYAVPVFIVTVVVGPAYVAYTCSPFFIPYIATAAAFPASIAFGYLLGVFYDAFGRLAIEQREEIEAAKRKEQENKKSNPADTSTSDPIRDPGG